MLLVSLFISAASAASQPALGVHLINPDRDAARCRQTRMSLTRNFSNGPIKAIPLTKLPSAEAFMAVDRHIDGCPAPLTMVQYRTSRPH